MKASFYAGTAFTTLAMAAAYAATATGDALHSSLGHVAAPDGEFHIKGSGLVLDGRLFAAVKVVAQHQQEIVAFLAGRAASGATP